ncbi:MULTISPECIES: hypothetical protein [unclassified Ramlibacter]|uniref:hypothetical protein n=1 Tax=unclassified Ramlibacter TaxID=2617605 RepID=UPI00366E559D
MTGPDAWSAFIQQHPELGYRPGRMNFHNFLRMTRERLIQADAIRRARGRHWIAHVPRFSAVAFELATGGQPLAQAFDTDSVPSHPEVR